MPMQMPMSQGGNQGPQMPKPAQNQSQQPPANMMNAGNANVFQPKNVQQPQNVFSLTRPYG